MTELSIEERLTRLEQNQKRHVALIEEIDLFQQRMETTLSQTNSYLNSTASNLRRVTETQNKIDVTLIRIDDTLLSIAEKVELLGVSYDGVYGALVQHIRDRRAHPNGTEQGT